MSPSARRAAVGPTIALAILIGATVLGRRVAASSASATSWRVAGVGALVIAALLPARAARFALVAVASLAIGMAAGAIAEQRATWGAALPTPDPVPIRVVLRADPGGHPFAQSVPATTVQVGAVPIRRTVLLRGSARVALRFAVLRLGDRVDLIGRIEAGGRGDRFRPGPPVAAEIDVAALLAVRPASQWYRRAGDGLRAAVESGADRLGDRDRALLLGFLLGDTRAIDRTTIDQFRAAGLTHLLAVSGANVAFVLALVGPALRRAPIVTRNAAGLSVVLVFAAATRFEPSVLRASAMAAVVMSARMSGRVVSPIRSLLIAVYGLLAWDADLLTSVGFRLSVVATAGIALFAGRVRERIRGPAAVRDAIAVTAAAQVAVAPFLVAEFGSFPAAGLIANLLAAPAAEPLTMYGMVAAPLAGVLPARAGAVVMAPCAWMLDGVRGVAALASRVPVRIDRPGLLVIIAVVSAIAITARARRGLRRTEPSDDPDLVFESEVGSEPQPEPEHGGGPPGLRRSSRLR